MKRIEDLKSSSESVQMIFESFDNRRTGETSIMRFKELITTLGILKTNRQIDAAIIDFKSTDNKSNISYVEFLREMNPHEPNTYASQLLEGRGIDDFAGKESLDDDTSMVFRSRNGHRTSTASRTAFDNDSF